MLTFEVVDRICDFIRQGNYQKVAAANCGIKERTWFNWLERAGKRKRPSKVQAHLLQSLAEAEAQFEALHVQRIFASNDPKISMEMLARKYPDRWAATRKTQIVDKDGDDVKPVPSVLVVPGIMDPDEWEAAAAKYKKMQPTFEEPSDADAVH